MENYNDFCRVITPRYLVNDHPYRDWEEMEEGFTTRSWYCNRKQFNALSEEKQQELILLAKELNSCRHKVENALDFGTIAEYEHFSQRIKDVTADILAIIATTRVEDEVKPCNQP